MRAKSKLPYSVQAFTGREFVRYEWRNVPDGGEDEARRLEEAGVLELQEEPVEFKAPPGAPDDTFPIETFKPMPELTPKELDVPITLGTDTAVSLSVDLESMTIIQLKDMARERELTGFSNMNKAELIAALGDD